MSPAFRKYSDCLKVNVQASMHAEYPCMMFFLVMWKSDVPSCPDLGKGLPFDIVRSINEDKGQKFWIGSFSTKAKLIFFFCQLRCKFKVYNVMVWYTYILRHDYRGNVNTFITSHNYFFVCVMRTFMIYSLNNFQVYNAVLLTMFTMLFIRSPELIHLVTGSSYSLTNVSPFLPSPSPWQPAIYSLFLWVLLF